MAGLQFPTIDKYFQFLTLEQLSKGREEVVRLPEIMRDAISPVRIQYLQFWRVFWGSMRLQLVHQVQWLQTRNNMVARRLSVCQRVLLQLFLEVLQHRRPKRRWHRWRHVCIMRRHTGRDNLLRHRKHDKHALLQVHWNMPGHRGLLNYIIYFIIIHIM